VIICHSLVVRLGFSRNAADSIASDQGLLNSVEQIGLLTDCEAVNLCKQEALRKPGEMVVTNPDAPLPK
jgi:hypothetical protein